MKQKTNTDGVVDRSRMPLGKRNYIIIAIGVGMIILGFILLAGGGSDSPDEFNYEMFNFRRLYVAPTLLLLGLAVEFYAIFYRKKS